MATQVTLDDIFAQAEETYGDYEFTDYSVKLRPLLRLSRAERKELAKLTKATEAVIVEELDEETGEVIEVEVEPEEQDFVELLQQVIILLADNKVGAQKLVEKVGDRLDVLKTIQENWAEKTQAGEAKPSSN